MPLQDALQSHPESKEQEHLCRLGGGRDWGRLIGFGPADCTYVLSGRARDGLCTPLPQLPLTCPSVTGALIAMERALDLESQGP